MILYKKAFFIYSNDLPSQELASNQSNIKTVVTFTLNPDNADSIPDNVVHLIVAEGVTVIPRNLCHTGNEKGFESLETVMFSKSVIFIGREAFHHCVKLK
jgi:hypothetical protein